MGRPSKPWYWKERRGWYVTIAGQRHFLGHNKQAAFDRFYQLMAKPRRRGIRGDYLAVLIDLFLEWCHKHRAEATYQWYKEGLQAFVRRYPNLRTDELRPFHVQEWLDSMTGVASGTRRKYCRCIKRVMRWGLQQGYIDQNPIAHLEQPAAGHREAVMSQQEYDRLLAMLPADGFRDLVEVTWETGCRPQESLRVEARHVTGDGRRWVFPRSESKGGIGRVVYLTARAAEITGQLKQQHPDGKLFRNGNGRAWTTMAVNCRFSHVQRKLGLAMLQQQGWEPPEAEIRRMLRRLRPTRAERGNVVAKTKGELYAEAKRKVRFRKAESVAPKYSLYLLRHSFATRALERGLDAVTVSILMGHRDPSTLARVYQHLSHNSEYLLKQADRAAG